MHKCLHKGKQLQAHEKLAPQDNYECPSCHKELLLKSGMKNSPYFTHKKSEGCMHRDPVIKPRENPVITNSRELNHKTSREIRAQILTGLEMVVDGFLFALDRNREVTKHEQ